MDSHKTHKATMSADIDMAVLIYCGTPEIVLSK